MKKIFLVLALVLLVAVSAQAEGIYSTVKDGISYEVIFHAGPFSPAEQGTVNLYIDGKPYQVYQYYLHDGLYHVYGLCDFIVQGNTLIAVKDLGITLYSETEQSPVD